MEYMVTEVCNLSCKYCTNYADYKTNVTQSWNSAYNDIKPWVDRGVQFDCFSLIGGEPLINPDLPSYIIGIRELMPNTLIQVVTNGTLIKNVPAMLDALYNAGHFQIHLTIHHDNQEYINSFINLVLNMPLPWQETQDKDQWLIGDWHAHKDNKYIAFRVEKPTSFLSTYVGSLENMRPYNNDPIEAFEQCLQKTCPLMYQGRLYKCSTTALLNRTLTDFNLNDEESWQPYLTYQGLSADCSDVELQEYVDNFGKVRGFCSMCPSQKDRAWKEHTVKWKKEIF